jgi:hypothetical protein
MTRLSRRAFVRGAAAVGASLLFVDRAQSEPRTAVRPHYVVQIQLSGGVDALLTVDSKDATKVGPGIDCGYRADERLRGVNRFYGPCFFPLMRHEADLAVVHGVRVDTVSHPEGHTAMSRGRIAYGPATPVAGDLIGDALSGSAPLRHLVVGGPNYDAPLTSRGYVSPLVHLPSQQVAVALKQPALFRRRPVCATIERARVTEAQALLGPQSPFTAGLSQAPYLSKLLDTLPRAKVFSDPQIGNGLHVALHAIRHNHAKFINVSARFLWFDSHTDNLNIQRERLRPALSDIALFIDSLKSERNAHGPLFDQTTIVIGSELGRYPKVNVVRGKDHWPENSWILLGKGIRRSDGGLTLGATGADYRGMEIDYRTGSLTDGDRRPIFIDTIYATLLKIAGGDPARHDFGRDAVLDALLA